MKPPAKVSPPAVRFAQPKAASPVRAVAPHVQAALAAAAQARMPGPVGQARTTAPHVQAAVAAARQSAAVQPKPASRAGAQPPAVPQVQAAVARGVPPARPGALPPPPLQPRRTQPLPVQAGVVQRAEGLGSLLTGDTDLELSLRFASFLDFPRIDLLSRVSKGAREIAKESLVRDSGGTINSFSDLRSYPVDPLEHPELGAVASPGHEDPWQDAEWDETHRQRVQKTSGQGLSSFEEYRQTVLWPQVRAAYLHMVDLVTKSDKKGERDVTKRANLEAQRVYGVFFGDFRNDCAAVVLRDDNPELLGEADIAVALNSLTLLPEEFEDLSPSSFNLWRRVKFRLENKYGTRGGYLVIGKPECSYMHAEIRLWEEYGQTGKLKYIGIQQPCCLYCAAQLLAAGFTGFPGCHMDVYKQYTFSPKILARPDWRERLLGPEASRWYNRVGSRERADFLREMAKADTVFALDAFRRQSREGEEEEEEQFLRSTKETLSPFEPGYAESSDDEGRFEGNLKRKYAELEVKKPKRSRKKARTKQKETLKRQPGPRGPKKRGRK